MRSLCGQPTKKGTACTRPPLSWPGPFQFNRQPWTTHCYGHLTPEERAWYLQRCQEERERAEAADLAWLSADPACWSWPVPDDVATWVAPLPYSVGPGDNQITQETAESLMKTLRTPRGRDWALLRHWHDRRCALCGVRAEHLIDDHDHASGLIRGLLCRSCNVMEGTHRGPDSRFGRYRDRHPARILGVSLSYWDPFLQEYAEPRGRVEEEQGDPMDKVPVYRRPEADEDA